MLASLVPPPARDSARFCRRKAAALLGWLDQDLLISRASPKTMEQEQHVVCVRLTCALASFTRARSLAPASMPKNDGAGTARGLCSLNLRARFVHPRPLARARSLAPALRPPAPPPPRTYHLRIDAPLYLRGRNRRVSGGNVLQSFLLASLARSPQKKSQWRHVLQSFLRSLAARTSA